MKLGINVIQLSRKFTGVGRCLLNEWSQSNTPFDEIILFSHTDISQDDVLFALSAYTLRIIGQPEFVQDDQYKKGIGLKGYERAKTISWRNTADRTIKKLWEVASFPKE